MAILLAPVSGCFSESEGGSIIPSGNLQINPSPLVGAMLQEVEFIATSPMSVHVPYLVREEGADLFTNGTTLHFSSSGSITIEMIAPSNIGSAFFILGSGGAFQAPGMPYIRDSNQSWKGFFASDFPHVSQVKIGRAHV